MSNRRLRAYLDETRCSNAQFARWVNAVGEERGLHLTYDKTSVARWLAGGCPHWPTPALVAEVLSRKLSQAVTVEDLGWIDRDTPRGAAEDETSLSPSPRGRLLTVSGLTEKDMRRRTFLRGAAWVATASAAPVLVTAGVPNIEPLAWAGERARLGMADVAALTETIAHYRGLDQRVGGAMLRHQLVRLLNAEVDTALGASYTEPVGRALYGVLSELACLTGYLTFDAGRHALAQRYYVQALGLAHAADDSVRAAIATSCLSFQAVHLRHGHEAVALARSALSRSTRPLTPALTALLHAIEARGLALMSDEKGCAAALGRAAADLDRSDRRDEPPWLQYFSPAELASHTAFCMLDLGREHSVMTPVAEALAGFDGRMLRSRGFAQTVQATAMLRQRQVEEACRVADAAAAIAKQINSSRGVEFLQEFNARLRRHSAVPAAREFMDRHRELLTPAS